MIRPLRRAHLGIVATVALTSSLGVLAALRGRPTASLDQPPAALAAPALGGQVSAAAAWPVEADTLYFELARHPADSLPPEARFTASAGARWPDAVVYWSASPEPLNALPADAVPLGVAAVGTPLVVRLPGAGGTVHLYSVAWDRHLGGWTLPEPAGGGS